jgi:exodeoxyribonuclease VII large subunit
LKTISLFDLNEFLRRVVALNFPESVWIRAEIAQLNDRRGNIYIELIEKDAETSDIIAQSSAIIWQRTHRNLLQTHGKILFSLLAEGTEVLIKANLTFHERYGVSLNIEDIDPSFTLGKMAILRNQTLEYLQKKGFLDLQKKIELPKVLQRIAVITSENAAGWADFREQLRENIYGYSFDLQLFDTSVQGQFAADEITKQLIRIKILNVSKPYDAVVIIRGGGSKIDLAVFDNQALNEAIAKFPLPIIAGIGHEIDETVLDFTAHRSLKTPTAVAEFLINRSMRFESELLGFLQEVKSLSSLFLEEQKHALQLVTQQVEIKKKMTFQNENHQLRFLQNELHRIKKQWFFDTEKQLDFFEKIAQHNDPQRIMQKGFSITKLNNKVVTSKDMLQKGDLIETIFVDGKIKSEIK